ncbi:MAG: DUF302 domain-containing protein [Gammaproteobacteria bacterium]
MPRFFPLLFIFLLLVPACERAADGVYEKTSHKTLPDILEDAEFSITEHNLRIVDRLHIGKSIRERGNRQFPDYEIFLYCSLAFAEKTLALKPDLINMCPGRISVRGTQNAYIISAPLWPEHNTNRELDLLMREMNMAVKTIVDYAAEDWPAPEQK